MHSLGSESSGSAASYFAEQLSLHVSGSGIRAMTSPTTKKIIRNTIAPPWPGGCGVALGGCSRTRLRATDPPEERLVPGLPSGPEVSSPLPLFSLWAQHLWLLGVWKMRKMLLLSEMLRVATSPFPCGPLLGLKTNKLSTDSIHSSAQHRSWHDLPFSSSNAALRIPQACSPCLEYMTSRGSTRAPP